MGVTNRLKYDPTDANSIAASSTIGSYTLDGSGNAITSTSGSMDTRPDSDKAEDAAHSSGDIGSFMLAVRNDTEGTLVDTDGDYAPLQVDASGRLRVIADVDVSNQSEKNEDAAHSSGDTGDYVLAVRADTRPTNANTSADGDYASFFVNANGELYVIDTDANALLTTIDADTGSILTEIQSITHAEDAAHVSGDSGIMSLAVRNDAGTALAADGDYIPLSTDSSGALRVVSSSSDEDDSLANTAIENTATAVSTTAVNVVTTALANRKWLYLANEGNKSLYFGKTGVTTANGFPLHAGMQLECRVGASVTPQIIGGTGASSEDLRVMELS